MDRKYIAISIKHTEYQWKYGKPCTLWGCCRTADDEKRCFSGYTFFLSRAELYSPEDFREHGYDASIVKPEPVHMSADLCKRWKKYDTVLVDEAEYRAYCEQNYIGTMPVSEG